MKYQKKVSVGSFLKKGEDIKDGDLVEVANEGKEVEGIVFDLADLPQAITQTFPENYHSYNRLVMLGNAGKHFG